MREEGGSECAHAEEEGKPEPDSNNAASWDTEEEGIGRKEGRGEEELEEAKDAEDKAEEEAAAVENEEPAISLGGRVSAGAEATFERELPERDEAPSGFVCTEASAEAG